MSKKQLRKFNKAFKKFLDEGLSEPAARRYAYAEAYKK